MRVFISFLMLLLGTCLYAQNGITIYGTYKVNGGDADGVQIRLLRNGIKEKSSISGSGKFKYNLDFNTQYELTFSKSEYITKKIVISTDVPERVLESNNNFPPFKITVELFPKVEGGDYSIFDEPVAMIIYDKELDDFDFDRAYDAEVKEEIKKVEAKIINTPIAVAPPKIDKKSLLYKELIKKADSEFEVKSYVDARKTYQKASKIKPEELYPKKRIELIDKILANLSEEEKRKEKGKAYYALIDKADVLFDKKKYQQARSYYEEALNIKANQQHPKDRISLIDQIFAEQKDAQRKYDNAVALGNRYFKEEKYKLARKAYEEALDMRKDEPYPQEQIKRIERLLADLKSEKEKEQNYRDAIAEADEFFKQKNWADAKVAYEKAMNFSDKRYPKEQLRKIADIVKSEQKELSKYSDAISRADKAFQNKEWKDAQKYYERALVVKPQEVYPQEQLKKITSKLSEIADNESKEQSYKDAIKTADRAFDRKEWEEAKLAYFKALKVKPNEKYPQEQIKKVEEKLAVIAEKKEEEDRYNEKLKTADIAYDNKAWNEALAQYKAALEMKPAEKYPKSQIKKIEQFLQEELQQKTAEEKENNYKELIAEGDTAYNEEQWEKAVASYEGALQIKPKDKYAKKRITAVRQAQKMAEEQQVLKQKYTKIIAQADAFFSKSEWGQAIAEYEKALNLQPKENYPKDQIQKIKQQLSDEELAKENARKAEQKEKKQKAYEKAVAMADKAFSNKQYGMAKQYYREAIEIFAEEKYPQQKLTEIATILQEKKEADNQYYKNLKPDEKAKQRFVKVISVTDAVTQKNETQKGGQYIEKISTEKANFKKYNELLEKAEQAEGAGNIPFARAYYRRAYLEIPSVKIFQKLKELDNFLELQGRKK